MKRRRTFEKSFCVETREEKDGENGNTGIQKQNKLKEKYDILKSIEIRRTCETCMTRDRRTVQRVGGR